jgi:hypothetical protein
MATTKVRGELVDLNEATSESGLKIPTGTNNNRPATDVAGMIRNNTNEASEGSASCEEYYNGAAWKKINNVAIPPIVGFKSVIWTGNASGGSPATQNITGLGFKPDWVWIKERTGTNPNALWDSTRGAGKLLVADTNAAESGNAGNLLGSFDADGFEVNRNYLGFTFYDTTNGGTSLDYVGWAWKANGGTTSSNTDGDITSTVQANTEAGFSIVSWTSTSSSSDTIGHGLGSKPDVVLYKKRTASGSWFWYTDVIDGSWDELVLNDTSAKSDVAGTYATSTTFKSVTSSSGADWITYCFHSVANYSKFGTYAGSGSNVNVVTGFQPTFVLVKNTGVEDWNIMDSTRGGSERLFPNDSRAESTTTNACIFNSDGFTIGVTGNASLNNAGDNYIYMAIK